MYIFVVFIYLLCVIKSIQSENGRINLLPLTIWGNQTLMFLILMLNRSKNERTKTAKRSLFVSDPSRSDRDQRARIYILKAQLFFFMQNLICRS